MTRRLWRRKEKVSIFIRNNYSKQNKTNPLVYKTKETLKPRIHFSTVIIPLRIEEISK